MCAIRRVVVVLPLVPVTAMMGMRAVEPGGNSMSTTGAATLRGRPFGGRNVHAEARGGVHFNHGPAAFIQRHGNVGGHHVDAADVEAHNAGHPLGQQHVVGVHLVGNVGGGAAGADVGRAFQVQRFAGRQHRFQREAAAFEDVRGVLVGFDAVSTFSWPTPRRGSLFTSSISC